MKLVIFGATGGTGRELLQQALDKGHEVTAIVRRPAAITVTHPRLHVIAGDIMQSDSLISYLQQQDAVLSALGTRSFKATFKPGTFYYQSARNLVELMGKARVSRLICVTSTGVLDKPIGPWLYLKLLKPLLKHFYEDMRQMEQVIQSSRLNWTIIRPPRLSDGKRTGHYRVGSTGELPHANSISRADVADYILNQLETPTTWQKAIAVAY